MGSVAPLRRQDKPPSPGPEILIIRVEAGSGFRGQILSESLWGVWTHWDGRRSRECTSETDSCIGHKSGWPQRWKGYLYVYCPIRKACCFLELTAGAAEQLLAQAPREGSLRGLLLRADRHGTSIRSKVTVELTRGVGDVANLPASIDPEFTLRKLWGWRS